ncbi:hypothetical protein RI054_35g134530 [Pseudoscourfieldia marina]
MDDEGEENDESDGTHTVPPTEDNNSLVVKLNFPTKAELLEPFTVRGACHEWCDFGCNVTSIDQATGAILPKLESMLVKTIVY